MTQEKVVVAGALGVIGRAVVQQLERDSDREVIGLSRRQPDFEIRARFLSVDLRDRDATLRALEGARDAEQLVYAALYEKPKLSAGWRETDHFETNLAMLRNLLDAIESPRLRHVTLLQGTKAYGAHLGIRMRLPARERELRVEHPNFYFDQEDFLRDRQVGRDWSWTILRPQVVQGVAVGSAMNVVASLAAFGSLMKALGRALSHPGHADQLTECIDARLLARCIEWAATAPEAAGEIFNVANGDVLSWRDSWPRIAEFFGLPVGDPQPLRTAEQMPQHAGVWDELVRECDLKPVSLDALIGLSWQYADMIWASPHLAPRPALVSTIKLRQAGFAECIDSEDALIELLTQMRDERYIP